MVEHVGAERLDEYARRLRGALRPGAQLLNHGITYLHQEDPKPGDFSSRYVFPDGAPQPLSRVLLALERAGLEPHHIEDFRADYAETLRHWARRLDEPRGGDAARGGGAGARVAALPAGGAQRLRDRLHLDLPGPRVVIGEALVRVRRGAGVESEHRVAYATTDRGRGGRAHSAGGGSAAYPGPAGLRALRGQAVPGAGGRARGRARALRPAHRAPRDGVRLARRQRRSTSGACARCSAAAGRSEADLDCGAAEPRDPARGDRAARDGGQPTPVRHNCSGKHAFGLAYAAAEGWPAEGYIDKGHPLQDAMESGLAEATGVRPGELARATDGCGMRTFSVPIARLAAAFGRLASGELGPAGERLAAAMSAHPELVAYDGAIDTELMRAHPRLVSKIGAEGVLGIGLPDGRGAALKVLDGATRALDVVAPLLLEEHWDIDARQPGARAAAGGAGAQLARRAGRRRRGDAGRVIDAGRDRPRHGRAGPGAERHRRRARRRSSGSASWPTRSASRPSCTSTTSPRCAPTRTTRARRRRATSCAA